MCNSYASLVMVLLCSACSSTFVATGASGASGVELGAGASSGGQSSVAGVTGGGMGGESSAGNGGVTGAEAGGVAAAGSAGSGAGAGGLAANPAGGSGGSGVDCVALIAEYAVEVEKARACDQVTVGGPDVSSTQCSPTSTLTAVGCFCPVLVNATSEHTTLAREKYEQIKANECDVGPVCDNVCSQYGGVGCGPSSTGTGYVCTGLTTVTAN